MATHKPRPNSPVPAQISETTIRDLLDVQKHELKNRSDEIALRHRELDHNSAHAEKILKAQERDRTDSRVHVRKMGYARLLFLGLIFLSIAGLVIAAMVMDKDQLALDIIKITVSLAAGAVGGYGYARSKQKRLDFDETDD